MATSRTSSYDEVPYSSNFFPMTHPDRMAAMATLFGLGPPDPARARVLELGCADGRNLLPMALTLPGAEFRGVDLSARQIDDGRRWVEALGLRNVHLEVCDLMDVDDALGPFDYVICHGVYSWVPPEARARILEIAARHLAPQGVAYVSYNTYPGWHLRGMVREMMLYHAGGVADPHERVRRARDLLEFLVKATPDPNGPYARALAQETKLLEGTDDTYIFHEHLEEVNHPVYFHEFAASASAHGLAYLGPARFLTPDAQVSTAVRAALDQLGPDRIRREQYLDFVRCRTFRQSLLCRAEAPHLDEPSAGAVGRLRAIATAQPTSPEPDVTSDAPEEFRSPMDDRLTTHRPLVKAALVHLYALWPRSASLDDLAAAVRDRLGGHAPPGEDTRAELAEILLRLNQSNLVMLSVADPPLVAGPSERPVGSPLARLQAEAGERCITLRLREVDLDGYDRAVLRLLDGSRDRAALAAALGACFDDGTLEYRGAGPEPSEADRARARAALPELLEPSLHRLARLALLMA